jgi:hypothetical protein
MKAKQNCKFPDETIVEAFLVETSSEEKQTLITYRDQEAGIQELWVPNNFLENN